MDRLKQKSQSRYQPRQQRVFSVELKKKLVEQIELRKLKVKDVVNLYQVSENSVYVWLKKYSIIRRTGAKMVVESESQEGKLDKLLNYISELERDAGRSKLKIEFLEKVIEICSKELGYDIKKKCITGQSNGID